MSKLGKKYQKKFIFEFSDYAKVRGVSKYAAFKAKERGDLAPQNLKSVLIWCLNPKKLVKDGVLNKESSQKLVSWIEKMS